MKKKIEQTYGKFIRGVMFTVNPIKKVVIKTPCIVHKYINVQAIQILNNDGYEEVAHFYKQNIKPLNEGATWADQDFRSTNHFFHYSKQKGLYGFSNALDEAIKYNREAVKEIKKGNINKSLFYVGVAGHLVQDATVPHHVNNKLLESHRKFEQWIISRLFNEYDFSEKSGVLRLNGLEDFVRANARFASDTYDKYCDIEDREEKYLKISTVILKQAQISTAGYFLNFYEEHIGKKPR